MQKINCDETSELLDTYFDGEVDALLARSIEYHLSNCPNCQKAHAEMQQTRNLVTLSTLYYSAPMGLKQKIQRSLPVERSRFNWLPKLGWAYAVGGCAVGILLALLFLNKTDTTTTLFSDELTSNHVRSLMQGHLMDVTSNDKHTVKPWFAGKIDYAFEVPDFTDAGFPLLGGRLDYLEHHQVAVLIYSHGKHIINVYFAPRYELPSNINSAELRGYHILGWTKSGLRYFAISDTENIELEKLERLFLNQ